MKVPLIEDRELHEAIVDPTKPLDRDDFDQECQRVARRRILNPSNSPLCLGLRLALKAFETAAPLKPHDELALRLGKLGWGALLQGYLPRSLYVGPDGVLRPDPLFLKHFSRILRKTVCGFSITEQVRVCAVWPTENWLLSFLVRILGGKTV